MKYAVDDVTNKLVEEHFKILVEEVNKVIKTKSIILYGSFSKGIGNVQKIQNKFHFVSDYDIIIVTEDKSIDKTILDLIKTNFENKINYLNILNIKHISEDKFKDMLPFLKYYELKNSSRILQGDNVLALIPQIDSKKIIFSDILTMLFDRTKLLLTTFPNKEEDLYERLRVIHNCGEFYISACNCLLSLKNKLDLSMNDKERAELFDKIFKTEFEELYFDIPYLSDKIKFFTNFRYKPNRDIKDWKKEWFMTRDSLLSVLKYIVKNKYHFNKKDWLTEFEERFGKEYISEYIPILSKRKFGFSIALPPVFSRFILGYMSLKYNAKVGNKFYKGISGRNYHFSKLYSGLIFSILAVDESGYKDMYIKKALTNLQQIYPLEAYNNDFNFLKEKYLETYNSFLGKAVL